MYAVFKTGGKQYRVTTNDTIDIERLQSEVGAAVEFSDVLMVGSGYEIVLGSPFIKGAKVLAKVVNQTRGPKLIAFKKRRRKDSKRKKGHRQYLTKIQIMEIRT